MRSWTTLALCLWCASTSAQEAAAPAPRPPLKIAWTSGPAQVDVGKVAEMKVAPDTLFAGPDDSRRIMERMGNPPSGREAGLIVPRSDDQHWFIVYEYSPVGFVKDDEKDRIDADALLASIKEGTEEANAERKKMGVPGLHALGWHLPPRYDAATHNLTWATLSRDDEGQEVVNHQVRVLGRDGYMAVTLVEDPLKIAQAMPALDAALTSFSYKQGRSYAEWVPGDKVSQYGLTALVAAGAGAAAVKVGLFGFLAKLVAKGGKLVVLLVAGIAGGVAKLWNAARGKASARQGLSR